MYALNNISLSRMTARSRTVDEGWIIAAPNTSEFQLSWCWRHIYSIHTPQMICLLDSASGDLMPSTDQCPPFHTMQQYWIYMPCLSCWREMTASNYSLILIQLGDADSSVDFSIQHSLFILYSPGTGRQKYVPALLLPLTEDKICFWFYWTCQQCLILYNIKL